MKNAYILVHTDSRLNLVLTTRDIFKSDTFGLKNAKDLIDNSMIDENNFKIPVYIKDIEEERRIRKLYEKANISIKII